MKSAKKMDKEWSSSIRIDNSLEQYKSMPLFQEKLDQANEVLRTVPMPKLPKGK